MMITLAGAVLAVAALLGPADAPGPDGDEAFVAADVDGDGVADPVTLRRIGPATQLLRVALADEIRDAVVPVDDLGGPVLPLAVPRPADLDGDGRAELLLVTAVGASTTTYQVWRFTDDRGLHAVTDEHGAPWRLYEGGGVAAISGYGCTGDAHRRPYVVEATWDESHPESEQVRYDGEAVTYTLTDGVARPVATAPLQDVTWDDPRVRADPATCAP